MTSEQFAYWLQGFTELNPSMERPTPEQWKSITEHLKTVFVKVTPPVKMDSQSYAMKHLLDQVDQFPARQWTPHTPGWSGQPVITC